MNEICKRCLLHESAEQGVYNDIKMCIEKLGADERTDESTYAARLEKCRECENLISGVCVKCGCYVEFRAAFKNKRCPDIAHRKW